MKNALSFDVEEYFQVANLQEAIPRHSWQYYESRLHVGMDKILKILDDNNTKATFFVLGWIAEHHKELVRDIHKRGHEVATHGYEHKLIYEMMPAEFKQDLKKSIDIMEGIINDKVIGHRASNFSVTKESLWSLDILAECGIRYDASIFPISHHRYGIPDAERFPHEVNVRRQAGKMGTDTIFSSEKVKDIKNGVCPHFSLWEFPCSTIELFGKNIPFSGGGYLRLLPYSFVRACIAKLNRASRPVMVYLHPWEFDERQPKIKTKLSYMLRHYINLDKTGKKLRSLLKDFSFTTVRGVLEI